MARRPRRPSGRQFREGGQFLLGCAVIAHEVFWRPGAERPTVLIVGAAMVGVTILSGTGRTGKDE